MSEEKSKFARVKAISVEKLLPGMILAEDVKNAAGVTALPSGTVLFDSLIETIARAGAAKVKIGVPAAPSGLEQEELKKEIFKTARVLVVDDSKLMRLKISNILADAGITVVDTAADGREGVELVRKHRPDVVTLDIEMPEMNGLAALAHIKKEAPNTQVIMISQFGQEEAVILCMKKGAAEFIRKPFAPEKVVKAVQDAILRAKKPPADESRSILRATDWNREISTGVTDKILSRARATLGPAADNLSAANVKLAACLNPNKLYAGKPAEDFPPPFADKDFIDAHVSEFSASLFSISAQPFKTLNAQAEAAEASFYWPVSPVRIARLLLNKRKDWSGKAHYAVEFVFIPMGPATSEANWLRFDGEPLETFAFGDESSLVSDIITLNSEEQAADFADCERSVISIEGDGYIILKAIRLYEVIAAK